MSTYASTLTPPANIRFANAYSADGSNESIIALRRPSSDWDYDAGNCPYKSRYLYFEGDGNQYQAQYRYRRRMVYSSSGSDNLNGQWGDWSGWSDSQFRVPAVTTADASAWDFANVTASHMNQPYITCSHVFGQPTNDLSEYDCIEYEMRVRRYRASDQRHGPWATELLRFVYNPGIVITTCQLDDSGALLFKCDTQWTRNKGEIAFSRIAKDGSQILAGELPWVVADIEGSLNARKWHGIPAKRIGLAGEYGLEVGDSIVFSNYEYRTSSGEVRAGKPITLTVNSAHSSTGSWGYIVCRDSGGVLFADIYQNPGSDQYEWTYASATCKWTDPDTGLVRAANADRVWIGESGHFATAKFSHIPTDVRLRVEAYCSNEATESNSKASHIRGQWYTMQSRGGAFLSIDDMEFSLLLDMSFSDEFESNSEHEVMAGRARPVARHGKGGVRVFNVTGDLVNERPGISVDDEAGHIGQWLKLKNHLHVNGTLRLPKGIISDGYVRNLSIETAYDSMAHKVSFEFVEVS